jgi:hypothetical protein
MFKVKMLVAIIAIIAPFVSAIDHLDFYEDGQIIDGYWRSVSTYHFANVDMEGHWVGHVETADASVFNYNGGSDLHSTILFHRSTFNFNNHYATTDVVEAWNSSVFNFNDGRVLHDAEITLNDYSHFNMNGGIFNADFEINDSVGININDGVLVSNIWTSTGYSEMNINGGDSYFENFVLNDYSVFNIYGGNVKFGRGFYIQDQAQFNIYYKDIIETTYPDYLAYVLLDDSLFIVDAYGHYPHEDLLNKANFIYVHTPEPSTVILLIMGSLFLKKNRK